MVLAIVLCILARWWWQTLLSVSKCHKVRVALLPSSVIRPTSTWCELYSITTIVAVLMELTLVWCLEHLAVVRFLLLALEAKLVETLLKVMQMIVWLGGLRRLRTPKQLLANVAEFHLCWSFQLLHPHGHLLLAVSEWRLVWTRQESAPKAIWWVCLLEHIAGGWVTVVAESVSLSTCVSLFWWSLFAISFSCVSMLVITTNPECLIVVALSRVVRLRFLIHWSCLAPPPAAIHRLVLALAVRRMLCLPLWRPSPFVLSHSRLEGRHVALTKDRMGSVFFIEITVHGALSN